MSTGTTGETMPQTAAEWADFLISRPLPSPFRVGQQTLKLMTRETLSYANIAERLKCDPVLGFYIMEASGRERTENTDFSKTLDHAISMIGLEQLSDTINTLPHIKTSSEDIKSLYYLQALSRSLLAACFARKIAEIKKLADPEALFWSTLFVHVPLWYLWCFATPEMRLTRYAVQTNHKARVQAQTEVLGCSIEAVAEELIKRFSMPESVLACYDPDNHVKPRQWIAMARHEKSSGLFSNVTDDREFRLLLQQPCFIIQLAKLLADNATRDWYSPGTLRAQKVMASYLNLTLAECVSITHWIAADNSRTFPIPGIMLPAARLFLPPQPRITVSDSQAEERNSQKKTAESKETAAKDQQKKTEKENQTARTTQPAARASAPKPVYNELVTAMYKSPGDFEDLHELMNGATSALVYGLGLGRATISLINKERTRLKTYYSTGCQEHSELAGFDVRLVKGTLFAKLASKTASVWLKPSSDDKLLSLVPMNFKQVIEVEDYFLMSLFVNEKPFAIVYCDAYPDKALSETDYKYFKYLCKGLGLALDYLVRNKSKKTG